ncbi:MAG: Uncharacterized protein G01um101425_127 [Candidatus Peregrinibacteria bacterium Gr01-1014_25]|nr:MAG: Uncharacterized protein G01um101425_127 [Candidatus Peregrinibacteria bacterium Gr01-1014_25]
MLDRMCSSVQHGGVTDPPSVMQKTCVQCAAGFAVTPEDLAFYDDMHVPAPTHCYLCRMQRRLSYRNERFLYHRKCNLTSKQIVSSFSIDKPFPVYDIDAWWSDDWDPLSYGREFDFNKPFFEQFFALRDVVPRLALQQQKPMVNSDYCNCASMNKNCYLVFSTNHCEDCYYGSWVNQSKDCLDNTNIDACELCYDCVGCRHCYNVRYSQECTNCSDSFFLRNCIGCSDCFFCFNQVQKQYMVFNEQKTEGEYKAFLQSVDTGSFIQMEKSRQTFDDFSRKIIVKEFTGTNAENCVGDYLQDSKNAFTCFECDRSEDIRYCMCVYDAKDSVDFSYWGGNTEKMYECQACGYDLFQLRFCNLCWTNCSDLTYCDQCFSTKNCFGCVSLKKQTYCILNKQCIKEEYEKLVPRIIEHMKRTGEWGEFFPVDKSIYAYNESLAQEQIPLTKKETLAKGWQWHDEEEEQTKKYMGPAIELPDSIRDASDDVTAKILTSAASGKPYKIIPQEWEFYQRLNIPLPRISPDERHELRLKKRHKRVLYERTCGKCQKGIRTTFAPNAPEIVYCEECYLATVY